jgi:hypothetical protein
MRQTVLFTQTAQEGTSTDLGRVPLSANSGTSLAASVSLLSSVTAFIGLTQLSLKLFACQDRIMVVLSRLSKQHPALEAQSGYEGSRPTAWRAHPQNQ